jgi:hypothetical protein
VIFVMRSRHPGERHLHDSVLGLRPAFDDPLVRPRVVRPGAGAFPSEGADGCGCARRTA